MLLRITRSVNVGKASVVELQLALSSRSAQNNHGMLLRLVKLQAGDNQSSRSMTECVMPDGDCTCMKLERVQIETRQYRNHLG